VISEYLSEMVAFFEMTGDFAKDAASEKIADDEAQSQKDGAWDYSSSLGQRVDRRMKDLSLLSLAEPPLHVFFSPRGGAFSLFLVSFHVFPIRQDADQYTATWQTTIEC
jgi:hypothetical protein